MKNKQYIVMGLVAVGLLATGSFISWKLLVGGTKKGDLRDEALLALIKNDQATFEAFIAKGGDMQSRLPAIDGKEYTVAQGLSYFERPNFVRFLQANKIPFIRLTEKGEDDILSLMVPKNNPELLSLYLADRPEMNGRYGDKQWTLMHLASIHCSQKLLPLLHEKAKLGWNLKAKDGSTPLTLAAEYECLPVLSYWKEQKADFKAVDGKGLSALAILKKKKDAALVAFAESFEVRLPAAVAPIAAPKEEVNFYKKRKIPKDQLADHTALVEPEARPIEPVETAEMSEFAD